MGREKRRNAAQYDEQYYSHYLGADPYERDRAVWRNHFRTMAETIVERYAPKRVLDVGCAKGFLVEHLRDCGVEAFGIDSSEYAISQAREDVKPFCKVASATDAIEGRYDLITCIEVAEHLSEEDGRKLVERICGHTDQVIFSSTPSDFDDDTHLNVRPAEHWLSLFAARGFYADLHFEPGFVTPHALRLKRAPARPLRVAVFSNEEEKHAVVRLRLLSPLRALERAGKVALTFVPKSAAVLDLERLLEADLFVFHREFATRRCVRVLAAANALRKPVVFETDDLLTQVPRSNPNFAHCTQITPDLLAMLRRADFVTVSTPRLADELVREEAQAKGKIRCLPNRIDPIVWGSETPPRPASTPLVIGWMGSPTHDEDLAVAKPAIAYVLRKYAGRVVFQTWGYLPADLADVPGVSLARGPEHDVAKHAADLRRSGIDFAIAPLKDLPFNHCKSNLKWLEYAACGIPGIYSAITPYSSSVVDGVTGLLADNTTGSWVAALERMIEEAELRAKIGRAAFEEIAKNYRLDRTAHRWLEAYASFAVSGPRPENLEEKDEKGEPASRAAAELLIEQADRMLTRGFVPEAVVSLESAADMHPQSAGALVRIAEGLAARGSDAAAQHLLAVASHRAADPIPALLALAEHSFEAGDPLRAEEVLRAGVGVAPDDERLGWPLAKQLFKTERAAEAAPLFERVLAATKSGEDLLTIADGCLRMERNGEALAALRRLKAVAPDAPNLAEMEAAVGTLIPKPRASQRPPIRIAVYATEPLVSEAAHVRLRSPLAVLEQAGRAVVAWSDGVRNADAFRHADVTVFSQGFAAACADSGLLARILTSRKPLVADVTDPAAIPASALERIAPAAAAFTVPREEILELLAPRIARGAERIVLLPDTLDLSLLPAVAAAPAPANQPLTLGIVTEDCDPKRIEELILGVLGAFSPTSSKVCIRTWGPLAPELARLPGVQRIATDLSFRREAARTLRVASLDLALVPAASAALSPAAVRRRSELRWMDFAACRVPCILPSRAVEPSAFAHGESAWLIPEAPRAWLEAIALLSSDHETRRRITHNAWTCVTGERATQRHAPRWLELYRALVPASPIASAPALVSAAGGCGVS